MNEEATGFTFLVYILNGVVTIVMYELMKWLLRKRGK